MPSPTEPRNATVRKPASTTLFGPSDLTTLLHAATSQLAANFDLAALAVGLKDVRDWYVLSVLDDGQRRTQLELSRVVCLDKTTLIGILDRLAGRGLIVRDTHPTDRRVRIPRITDAGREVHSHFAVVRDETEAQALAGLDAGERKLLMTALTRMAYPTAEDAASEG